MLRAGVSEYHSTTNNIHSIAGEMKKRFYNSIGVASYFVRRRYFSESNTTLCALGRRLAASLHVLY